MRPLFACDLAGDDNANELKLLGPLVLHDHEHTQEPERQPEHVHDLDDHNLHELPLNMNFLKLHTDTTLIGSCYGNRLLGE